MQHVKVSIQPLTTYEPGAVKDALIKLLAPLGGIEKFISPGQSVMLKPNLLMPKPVETAVCTHPEIIRQTALLAATANPSQITITDSPGMGTAVRVAKKLGLTDSKTYKVINTDDIIERHSPLEGAGKLRISKDIMDGDVLINIPKAKTHGQMKITAAAKNTFGCVVGLEKAQWHYRMGKNPDSFAELLVHVHQTVSPALNILDGVIGMEGNGPGSGQPRHLGFLMASTNAHALDYVLTKIWEVNPKSIYTLNAAKAIGVLPTPEDIEICGTDINAFKLSPRWKMATPKAVRRLLGPNWMIPVWEKLMETKPHINHPKCTVCSECVRVCAAKAMLITPTREIQIDDKKCISCFCCQEMCPQGAITVRTGPLARLLGLGRE